jgi:hypothetical protein
MCLVKLLPIAEYLNAALHNLAAGCEPGNFYALVEIVLIDIFQQDKFYQRGSETWHATCDEQASHKLPLDPPIS